MKKLIVGVLVTLSFTLFSLGMVPSVAQAAKNDSCHKNSALLNFPTWYEYLEVGPKGNDPCAIIGPTADNGEFSFQKALPRIGLALVEILLRVAGAVAVVFTIFGGFKYMTSQGEPDATKQAQATVTNALIGLAISVLATAIVGFIGSKLW